MPDVLRHLGRYDGGRPAGRPRSFGGLVGEAADGQWGLLQELADRRADAEPTVSAILPQQQETRSVDELLHFIEADKGSKSGAAARGTKAAGPAAPSSKGRKKRGKKKTGPNEASAEQACGLWIRGLP